MGGGKENATASWSAPGLWRFPGSKHRATPKAADDCRTPKRSRAPEVPRATSPRTTSRRVEGIAAAQRRVAGWLTLGVECRGQPLWLSRNPEAIAQGKLPITPTRNGGRARYREFLAGLVTAAALEATGSPAWETGPGFRSVPVAFPTNVQAGLTLLAPTTTGLTFTNLRSDAAEARNRLFEIGSGVALGDVVLLA